MNEHAPMPLDQAVRQLEGRRIRRADLPRGSRIAWSVADAAAVAVVLRELRRLQAQIMPRR